MSMSKSAAELGDNPLANSWATTEMNDRLNDVAVHTVRKSQPAEKLHSLGKSDCHGNQVRLHVYDLSDGCIQKLNKFFAHKKMPVKFGGMFHVGVEVYGFEWAFGFSEDMSQGVWLVEPRMNPQHCFRQTVDLGETNLSRNAFTKLISEMREDYPGQSYDMLSKNCCTFAEDLCQRLGVAGIPKWVNRLARIGTRLDNILHLRIPQILPRSTCSSVVGGYSNLQ